MTPFPDRRHRSISRALQLFLGLSIAAAAHAAPTVGSSALTGDDGTWNRLPFIDQGTPYGYLVVSDAVHGRLLAFESSQGTSWSLDLTGTDATWSAVSALGSPPPPLNDPAAIYDPVRNRIIVHGGANPTTNVTMGDVWALDLDGTPTWEQITVSGSALRRQGHTATYDPIGDRMIVFGGLEHLTSSGAYTWTNTTYALPLSGPASWISVAVGGTPPPGRWYHAAAYDAARGRLVVFGGETSQTTLTRFNDVWTLDLNAGAWAQLAPSGSLPSARILAAMEYEPSGDRLILFGGYYPTTNETWQLTLSGSPAWSLLAATNAPLVPSRHALVFDAPRQRMVTAGGYSDAGVLTDAWALPLVSLAWQQLTDLPPARHDHSAVYDSQRHRIVVFGGMRQQSFLNDTWVFTPGAEPPWSHLETQGPLPPARINHTAIYDPVRDRMIVFGGRGTGYGYLADAWVLSFGGVPTWSPLGLAPGPAPRAWHTAVYDPDGDRMWILGGERTVGIVCGPDYEDGLYLYPSDAWTLNLSGTPAWTHVLGGVRDLCSRQVAVFDRVSHRIVVQGGERDSFACYTGHMLSFPNTLIAISTVGPTAVRAIAASGAAPPALAAHTAAYDGYRNRMIVFGGYQPSFPTPVVQGEAWALDLSAENWSHLVPAGPSPGRSQGHAAVFDPDRDAMWLYSIVGNTYRQQGDHEGDGSIWSLQFEHVASVPAPDVTRLAIDAVTPNPSRGALGVWLTLPSSDAASLEVYDAGGRLAARRDVSALGAGRHRVNLDDPRLRTPGLYFIRLNARTATVHAKAVVVN